MRVVDPGHQYELAAGNSLVFLQKAGSIVRDGTTYEELLEVLIDRLTGAYRNLPCEESIRALHLLQMALETFRRRTEKRKAAEVEGTHQPHFASPSKDSHRRSVATDFDHADTGPG